MLAHHFVEEQHISTDKEPKALPPKPKKGSDIEVEFEALTYGGQALARAEGYVVFAKHAAPGDRARVRLMKTKKNYGEGQIIEIVRRAPERIEPVCPIFGTCGGCSWQFLPIEVQERWKARIVRDALRPLPGWEDIPVEPLVASPSDWRYRNKMEFTFGTSHDGKLISGFHMPSNWRQILDVEKCWLGPESMERVLRAAVNEGRRQGATAWNPRQHEGTLRHLVVRHSVEEDALLAMLLTGDKHIDFDALAREMFEAEPRLKGLAWGLNDSVSDVARPSEIFEQRGAESFDERLGKYRFRISLASFFQTNTRGAERLYEVARDALELTGNERLLDAYCGTGTIGIFCADQVKEVYGIELVQEAIWDARANAARNGIENATFMAGDMRRALPVMMGAIEGSINRLVVDPPRGGMDKKALEQLLNLRAPIVAYVSCNPTTMARDLEAAIAAGYRIERVTPVDMFPQTYHVECVAKLRLMDGGTGVPPVKAPGDSKAGDAG